MTAWTNSTCASALMDIFQYSSLAENPFHQWRLQHGAFQIQDKSRHGLVKMTHSGDNWWCPYKYMFCLKNVLDGRNETLKATLFLVVAVRDPRILDLMILAPMILAPRRYRRAWRRDGQSLEGDFAKNIFCDSALGIFLWGSSNQTRSWISFWFPASFFVNWSLLVTCERKLKLWQQTRHIDGGRPLCIITDMFLSHQLERTRSRQDENAKGKSPVIAGWGMWLLWKGNSSVAVKWCTEECP